MARAVDGEALFVQQIADAPDQQDLVMLVVAPVPAPLDGLELGKFLFPIPQHVRLDRTQVAHLANGEVALGGDGRKVGVNSAGIRHDSVTFLFLYLLPSVVLSAGCAGEAFAGLAAPASTARIPAPNSGARAA